MLPMKALIIILQNSTAFQPYMTPILLIPMGFARRLWQLPSINIACNVGAVVADGLGGAVWQHPSQILPYIGRQNERV